VNALEVLGGHPLPKFAIGQIVRAAASSNEFVGEIIGFSWFKGPTNTDDGAEWAYQIDTMDSCRLTFAENQLRAFEEKGL
jgi:hypothetical protein